MGQQGHRPEHLAAEIGNKHVDAKDQRDYPQEAPILENVGKEMETANPDGECVEIVLKN